MGDGSDDAGDAGTTHRAGRPPKCSRRRLSTTADVRIAMSYTLRRLEAGSMDVDQAKALIYGYRALHEIINTQGSQDLQAIPEMTEAELAAAEAEAAGAVQ